MQRQCKRSPVFSGRLLKVFKGKKTLPNGKKAYIEEIDHPGAVLVVPRLGKRIVFIRQYRAVIGKYIWELPAGTLEVNETPYKCAKREVSEETGYGVSKLKKIGFIYTTPGFCNEKIHIFEAECTCRGEKELDEDELIRLKLLTALEVRKLFLSGRINDSKTVAALAFAGVL
ncbi:MAG: NUDIX hydrolase [Candidatus Omnitrophica bacterium]|nr:NUDIX hydrolase [Candidatus Omnitrophota bacterium]